MKSPLPPILAEAAEGSRELDAAVVVALGCPRAKDREDLHYLTVPQKADRCTPGTYWFHSRSGMSLRTAPPLTTSLDAIVALIEEKLPGWSWGLNCYRPLFEKPVAVLILSPDDPAEPYREAMGEAATPPLALCLALLRALESTND